MSPQRGDQGETGQTGTPGATGASGATGATGDAGQRGRAGDPGVRGPAGRAHPARVTWAFIALTVIFTLLLGGLAYALLELHEQADRNSTALYALCAQRADTDKTIARTDEIMARFPTGPIFGIPRSVVEQGQVQRRMFRANLNRLDC